MNLKIINMLLVLFVGTLIPLYSGCSGLTGPDPNVRYIAFGDSTTAGPNDKNYWDFLREKLGEPADAFAGQGEGGEKSDEGLTRLNDLLANGLYPNAQVLLYWEGGDDLVELVRQYDPLLLLSPDDPNFPFTTTLDQKLSTIQANIEAAIQAGHDAGLTVLAATYYYLEPNIFCKFMPLQFLTPDQAARANAYVVKLNIRIRQAVNNQNAILVDVETIGPALTQDPANYTDCNHLSDKGNAQVADLFLTQLQSLKGSISVP